MIRNASRFLQKAHPYCTLNKNCFIHERRESERKGKEGFWYTKLQRQSNMFDGKPCITLF